VTVPTAAPVVVSVCEIVEPDPELAPVAPTWLDGPQLYVVPPLRVILELLPEQIAGALLVIPSVGTGFTVMLWLVTDPQGIVPTV
jgi:hypothetical protein